MKRHTSALSAVALFAICGPTHGGDGKSEMPFPGPTAEVRTHNGVPALFIDNLDVRTNIRRRRRNEESTNRVQIRFDVFGYRKQAGGNAG